MTTASKAGAEGVRWDLTLLASSEDAMKERMDAAAAAADSFPDRWPRDSIAAIEPPALAQLLRELGELRAARSEAEQWVFMLARTEAENPAVPDLQAWLDALMPRFDEALRHFELAWSRVAEDRATELATSPDLAHERHYLLSLRRFQPFLLSAPEERVLAAREATASTAWRSLYMRTLGRATVRFDDGEGERVWGLGELDAASRSNPDREVRGRAAAAMDGVLTGIAPVLAQCYDSLVADHLSVDGLRGHADPMERRNLENEIDGAVVEQLLATCEQHHHLALRWFEVKARLLGLERLDTIDLFAPVLDAPVISWDEGHRMAVDVFASLSPTLASHAEAFFSQPRIDAEPRVGKVFGGFSSWPSTRSTGFLYLNWTGSLLDLVILTHELGHGTHFALAASAQSDNSLRSGLTILEIPSTLAHLRLVEDQLASSSELAPPLLARVLDSAIQYVFVRSALTRYEQKAYQCRAAGDALTSERLSDLCDAALRPLWGDAMSDDHGLRGSAWAPMPHMVHAPFYLYAYAFAFLLAAGLLARLREPDFGPSYERFLAAGASASPEELLGMLGLDLNDASIWKVGFAVIERWIDRLGT